jgi:hypothetical protein
MKCRFCSNSLNDNVLIDLGTSPASNAYVNENQLHKPELFFPLKVMVCDQCWLVQTLDFIEREELFTSDYDYHSSYSSSFLNHAKEYVEKVSKRFLLNEESFVIEVASNDGYLLQYFKNKKINHLGIEPTKSAANIALEKGVNTVIEFFGEVTAKKINKSFTKADLMVANNVLAHVPDINDFLKGFEILLKDEGVLTFEFPHLVNLINETQFDTIYHEHFSYISLISLKSIIEANGMVIFDVEKVNVHGGSLRVYCQKSVSKRGITLNVSNMLNSEKELGLANLNFYGGFQNKALKIKTDFMDFLIQSLDKKVAGYGAAAKGNTLLNYVGLKKDLIPFVVDKNPSKVGKYMPGSRIPIVDENELKIYKPDFVIVFPWNLIDEISIQLDYIKEWGGKLVTFIPKVHIHE